MSGNAKVIAVVFDYLKILFKDENKDNLFFLDMMKNNLKKKLEKSVENCLSFLDILKNTFLEKAEEEDDEDEERDEESKKFVELLSKRCKQNKEIRQEIRKSILEDLLKNGEDDENDDINIYRLIELFVEKNKSKKEPDE